MINLDFFKVISIVVALLGAVCFARERRFITAGCCFVSCCVLIFHPGLLSYSLHGTVGHLGITFAESVAIAVTGTAAVHYARKQRVAVAFSALLACIIFSIIPRGLSYSPAFLIIPCSAAVLFAMKQHIVAVR